MAHLQPKVYIIILHWKNIACLLECLSSINRIMYDNYTVTVVNNSSNDLIDIDKHLKLKIQILKSPFNVGFARGNNLGLKEALKNQADYVLLLNDDTVVSPDFLNILVDTAEKNSNAGMLGPKIYYFDEPHRIWFAGAKFNEQTGLVSFLHSDEKLEESDYVTGCALLAKRKLIEKIGLLNERFFLYWEDVNWGLASKKAGFRNLIVPSSKVWHKISLSSGGPNSCLRVYHKTRSHLLFLRLHAPKAEMKLMLRFLRDIAWLLFKSSDPDKMKKAQAYFAAIVDYHLGKTGKGPHWLWVDN